MNVNVNEGDIEQYRDKDEDDYWSSNEEGIGIDDVHLNADLANANNISGHKDNSSASSGYKGGVESNADNNRVSEMEKGGEKENLARDADNHFWA